MELAVTVELLKASPNIVTVHETAALMTSMTR
jgi:hypothetical protein